MGLKPLLAGLAALALSACASADLSGPHPTPVTEAALDAASREAPR